MKESFHFWCFLGKWPFPPPTLPLWACVSPILLGLQFVERGGPLRKMMDAMQYLSNFPVWCCFYFFILGFRVGIKFLGVIRCSFWGVLVPFCSRIPVPCGWFGC